MGKFKLMFALGTRPEAIKLAPVLHKAREQSDVFDSVLVATAQHREMLDDVLRAFDLKPDIDLNIMAPGQSLYYITGRIFTEMEKVMADVKPDVVVVQGDTTTTFASAMAGYYAGAKIAYVEAGLRTGDKWAPFPEEINRKAASTVADFHFPPTESSRQNLLHEGYSDNKILVTGNTVIDALKYMVEKLGDAPCPVKEFAPLYEKYDRFVLITGHRRENFGEPFRRICRAFRELADRHREVCFVYPVHLNPNVQSPVNEILGGLENFKLLAPLPYPEFVWFMQNSYMIISDSGGVQEEAPALGKPVLVTRRVTERPEAVEAGVVKLVGDDDNLIFNETEKLITDSDYYKSMARGVSPYGDGKASERILNFIQKRMNLS